MNFQQRRAFTLIELIAAIVVTGILSALAAPGYAAVRQQVREHVTVTEAESLADEAHAIAAFSGRDHLLSEDFGTNDLDRSIPGVQLAVGESPWAYTSVHAITVYIYDDGMITDAVATAVAFAAPPTEPLATGSMNEPATTPEVSGTMIAPTDTSIATPTATPAPTSTSTPTFTEAPAPAEPVTVDLMVTATSTTTTLAPELATFVDSYNGAGFVRQADGMVITFSAANWESITLVRVGQTDKLLKTKGPSTVGALTRVTNLQVNVGLDMTTPYAIVVKYNGGSQPRTYTVTSIIL